MRVPRGYRGLVIAAEKADVVRFASGSEVDVNKIKVNEPEAEVRGKGRTRRDQWPLTPATSTTSVVGVVEEDGTEMRRSPRKGGFERLKQRVKGAGQVARARPKRAIVKTGKKRFRLDSDDDEDDITPSPTPERQQPEIIDIDAPPHPATSSTVQATPSKRARQNIISTPTRQSPRLSQPRTPAPPSSRKTHLPAIVLQEATPLKEPLPPPPPHLRKKKGKADYVIPGSPGAVPEEDDTKMDEAELIARVKEEEAVIIPSPATENDPPTFPIPSPVPSDNTPKIEESEIGRDTRQSEREIAAMMDIEGAMRVLRPISTFDAITLWTPDAALAGYKVPNGEEEVKVEEEQGEGVVEKGKGKAKDEVEEDDTTMTKAEAEAAGPRIRQGWWAQGGSGEGGDEIVRAMGEWLGLVEMVS